MNDRSCPNDHEESVARCSLPETLIRRRMPRSSSMAIAAFVRSASATSCLAQTTAPISDAAKGGAGVAPAVGVGRDVRHSEINAKHVLRYGFRRLDLDGNSHKDFAVTRDADPRLPMIHKVRAIGRTTLELDGQRITSEGDAHAVTENPDVPTLDRYRTVSAKRGRSAMRKPVAFRSLLYCGTRALRTQLERFANRRNVCAVHASTLIQLQHSFTSAMKDNRRSRVARSGMSFSRTVKCCIRKG